MNIKTGKEIKSQKEKKTQSKLIKCTIQVQITVLNLSTLVDRHLILFLHYRLNTYQNWKGTSNSLKKNDLLQRMKLRTKSVNGLA